MKLHTQILLAMVIGAAVGVGMYYSSHEWIAADETWRTLEPSELSWQPTVAYFLNLLGATLFLGALKMIFAPLILASIVAGVVSLPDIRELGSIGVKVFVFYFITTTMAVLIGIGAVLLIAPGERAGSQDLRTGWEAEQETLRAEYQAQTGQTALDEDSRPRNDYVAWLNVKRSDPGAAAQDSRFRTAREARDLTPGQIFKESVVNKLLMNPFNSLSGSTPNALGIIFFALLLGVACTVVGEPARHVVGFFEGASAVIMEITHWIMRVAPLCIGCLVAEIVAENGPQAFQGLAWYCGTVIAGILTHWVFLLTVVFLIAGVTPWRMWRGLREAILVAFTTRSSAATLPVTIDNVVNKLEVSPKIANFALPVGATVNMDGTSLYQAIAIIFLVQLFGGMDDVNVPLTGMTLLLIVITAVLASVGAAAIPSAGLVTMAIVATAVNLPFYYITVVFAVDAVLDMFRTVTNILGDSVGCIVVNRLERGRLNAAPESSTWRTTSHP